MGLGIHTKRLLWAAVVWSGFGVTSCGNRGNLDWAVVDHCKPGLTACLSAQVGQICNEQGQWATFQCAANQKCKNDACVDTTTPCVAGANQCLSAQVGQICNQQGQWVTLPCATNQACQPDQGCIAAPSSCTSGAHQCLTGQASQTCGQDGQWVTTPCKTGESCSDGQCQGACTPNLHECVTERLQRICLGDGSAWATSSCPDGMKCENGECVGSCVPSSRGCASTRVLRECRLDGGGYVEQQCPDGTVCQDGACVDDVKAACSPGYGYCKDKQTRLRCKLDGSGYEPEACKQGTECRQDECMGPICAAGATSCTASKISNLTAVQTCNADGTGYNIVLCRAHEKCIRNESTQQYECYLPPCNADETLCGDPAGTYSGTDRLTRCETLPDGKLGWASYTCSAPAKCAYDERGTAACHADCAPGDQRCSSRENAIEICADDGKWYRQSCDVIGSGLQACLVVPVNQHVVCGDPDCRELQSSLDGYRRKGRCSGPQIRTCGLDGRLQAPVSCETGMCLPESNGFGTCKDPNRCNEEDGWRECVTGGDAFRTCLSNHWEFTPCASNQQCVGDDKGYAACGNNCTPPARRCSGSGYQICSENGTWGPAIDCDVGECNPLTARCETACQEGEVRCVGDVVITSDGSSLGSVAMQVCQAGGSWGPNQACATGQSCRRSGHGIHLGCVDCVGATVVGGNEENTVDSRCSPDGTGHQTCSSSNTWPGAYTTCATGEQCNKHRDGTIRGTCTEDGCSSNSPQRCLGFSTLSNPETISDCCAGDCQALTGECWHRQSQYDPSCLETTQCSTGRYDGQNNLIYETCCNGFCKSGQGCLRIKGAPCATVSSCTVKKLGRSSVCCGSCQTDGNCVQGQEAEHPSGEYFNCGSTSSLCWGIGACIWSPASSSGAMYTHCELKSTTVP